MNESLADVVANLFVVIAWVGCSLFILYYSMFSNWRATLPGRTLMYSKVAIWGLLSYVLWARWASPPDDFRNLVAVFAIGAVAYIQWRLFITLRLVQTKRITVLNPNYTPVRDWLARRRANRQKSPTGQEK